MLSSRRLRMARLRLRAGPARGDPAPAGGTGSPVAVVEPRSAWPGEFEALRDELQAALGALALRIDHIGSTAVQALPAKDVIDIQVTVPALDAALADRLRAAGFVCGPDPFRQDHVPPGGPPGDADWAKLLFRQRPGMRRCHIHVRQAGRANQRYALLVRDYLRADPASAQAYGELKRRLAAALSDPDLYPEVKDPVSDLIHRAAERWAREVGWVPDPPAPA